MLALYALKCDEGYIRDDNMQGCQIVSLEKATVFNKITPKDIHNLFQQAIRNGANNIRLVQLHITENVLMLDDQIKQILDECANE